jgi:hypothetical protein
MKLKKTRIFVILFTLVLVSFCGLISITNAYNQQTGTNIDKIAIVYDGADDSDALAYQSFLDSNGYSTDLVPLSDVNTTSFSGYSLIIIDPESGSSVNWGDASIVNAINNSNKHILGLGSAGYGFFGELGLFIGYPHGLSTSGDSIYIPNNTLSVFKNPYQINNGTIQLFTTSFSEEAIYIDSHPSNVTILALTAMGSSHSPLLEQANDYILWGFDGNPSNMTITGQHLFLNVVNYIKESAGGGLNIPGYEILILGFITLISLFLLTRINLKKIRSKS